MPIWKQFFFTLILTAGTLVIWAMFIPSAAPVLERAGLLVPMQRIGLVGPSSEAPQSSGPGFGGAGGGTVVVAGPAGEGVLNDLVTAIGTGQALRSVVIMPEVAGRIAEVAVTSGQTVESGDLIARLDSAAEQIALERARLVLSDAEATVARLQRLQASGAASEIQIRDADLAVQNAQLGLRQAEFDLSRRALVAPIGGAVGILNIEPGSQVTSSSEITRIDDRSSLLVEFRVPERLVAELRPGHPIEAVPLARPGQTLDGHIRAVDNRVDQATRTLLMQAEIENPDDSLRAGMAFSISLRFEGERLPTVDPLSIQWGAEGSYVWIVRDGLAERMPVRIMQRSTDAVLVRSDLAPGDMVIREGVTTLRPGSPVQIKDMNTAATPATLPPVEG